MRKSRFTEQQIAFALRQAETGTKVKEVVRKLGITEQTFYLYGLLPHCKRIVEESARGKSVADIYTASSANGRAPEWESRPRTPQ